MKKYEPIDISGDVGLRAFGKTINEVFINAAEGMYSLITNLDLIREEKNIDITIDSSSVENLLVAWLNELIFHFDTYGFIGKRIVITETSPSIALPGPGGGETNKFSKTQTYTLKAAISGEDFDQSRHESKLLIKAATYHRLRIEKINNIYEAEVIFDI